MYGRRQVCFLTGTIVRDYASVHGYEDVAVCVCASDSMTHSPSLQVFVKLYRLPHQHCKRSAGFVQVAFVAAGTLQRCMGGLWGNV